MWVELVPFKRGGRKKGDLNVRKVKEGAHGMAPSFTHPNERTTKTLMMKNRDRLRPICPISNIKGRRKTLNSKAA